jgi:hypothetical protein
VNAIVPVAPASAPNTGLMPANMDQAMRLAEMMSTAKLVPAHLQGKPGDCLLVIEQAMRWGMSPFAVAQATSVIQGRLMFEGKLVSAALNASGILSNRMTFDYEGEGASRAVTASAMIRGETTARTIRCTLAEAKTTNGMWVKQPDQQLAYFTTRAWARRHAPEVMLGVYAPEEFDTPPPAPFRGTTLEASPTPPRSPPPASSARQAINDEIPSRIMDAPPAPPKAKRTYRQLLDETAEMLNACDSLDAVIAIGELPAVLYALANANDEVQREMNAILCAAVTRWGPDPDPGTAESVAAEAEADGWPGPK